MKSIIILLFLFSSILSRAQNRSPLEGSWEGKLNLGVELRIVFHINQGPSGSFHATADSPDQSAFDLPCDTVIVHADSVQIIMNRLQAKFTGKLVDDSTISGQLTQGSSFPVILKKNPRSETKKRTQIPTAPFPYKIENITYQNPGKTISFGATLTIPEGNGPFPAVILISGSGPQDRNSNVLEHPTFGVLADHLSRNGILVLRYDERGIGESTGSFAGATSLDFSRDAEAALDYLLQRKETDKKRVGLVGHSEGGMIAPMIAASRKDISFLVLLAAPGVPVVDLMALQNEAIARSAGMPGIALNEVSGLFTQVVNLIRTSSSREEALTRTREFLDTWIRDKDATILAALNLYRKETREEYITAMVEQLFGPWFRFFINYDPGPSLEKVKAKVLALNGSSDLQVVSSQNLPAIEASLKKGKSDYFEVHELPGLNHLFQTCKRCTLQEYGELEETFSPLALKMITDWINLHVK